MLVPACLWQLNVIPASGVVVGGGAITCPRGTDSFVLSPSVANAAIEECGVRCMHASLSDVSNEVPAFAATKLLTSDTIKLELGFSLVARVLFEIRSGSP